MYVFCLSATLIHLHLAEVCVIGCLDRKNHTLFTLKKSKTEENQTECTMAQNGLKVKIEHSNLY